MVVCLLGWIVDWLWLGFVANQVMVELGKALSGYDSKQFKEVRNHLEELPCVDKPADLVLCCASLGSLEDSKWLHGPEWLVAEEMCWSLHRCQLVT